MTKKKDIPPTFNPGSKPYCEYGQEVLNKNVPWHNIVTDIQETGYSLVAIASIAETPLAVIQEITHQRFDNLPFRSGAKLISLHYSLCPSKYVEQNEIDA